MSSGQITEVDLDQIGFTFFLLKDFVLYIICWHFTASLDEQENTSAILSIGVNYLLPEVENIHDENILIYENMADSKFNQPLFVSGICLLIC